MQNPYRRVSYKVQLLLTISILTCGIIQSSPKISLIELDCITIYNGINQTPQDENLSWELKQDAKKARERTAVEREKQRKAAAAKEKEKQRKAVEEIEKQRKAAEENEKQRKAAEEEKKLREAEREKKRIAAEKEKEAIKAAPATEFENWSMAEARSIREENAKSILVLYIFLTAISLLSLYLYNRNRKLQKDIEYLYNRNRNLQKDIEKQEKDIIKLIEDLKKTKQELTENKIINATINQQLIEERDIIPTKEIKEISKVVEKFYMSTPSSDGSFSIDSKHTNYDPTSCFYSFVDNEDGTFLFRLEEGSLNLALKYPHKIIDPVCDIVDGSLQYSTNVDIVRYGKAVQSKDTFKVIEKLKIRLI